MNYSVTASQTPSAAAAVFTLQQPTSGAKRVSVRKIIITSTVQAAIDLENNGGSASATSATPVPIVNGLPASTVLAFSASNATAGTVWGKLLIPANGQLIIDLDVHGGGQGGGGSDGTFVMAGNFGAPSTVYQLNIRTAAITGTVTFTVIFREDPDF